MIYSVPKQTINIALLDVRVDSMARAWLGAGGGISSPSPYPASVSTRPQWTSNINIIGCAAGGYRPPILTSINNTIFGEGTC